MSMPKKKQCTKCGERKAVDEFYSHPGTRDGLQSNCMSCTAIYTGLRRRSASLLKKVYLQEALRQVYNERGLFVTDGVVAYSFDATNTVFHKRHGKRWHTEVLEFDGCLFSTKEVLSKSWCVVSSLDEIATPSQFLQPLSQTNNEHASR